MDVMWAAGGPLRVREVADELSQNRPLAFNTVQTVMEILFREGWLDRQKSGRAYRHPGLVQPLSLPTRAALHPRPAHLRPASTARPPRPQGTAAAVPASPKRLATDAA
jgi:hypothetical protein